MGKIAVVFPGQGAQYSGMGKDLYENSPASKGVFDRLEILSPGIIDLCFNGSEEALKETKNTQPAMFAVEAAAYAALKEACIHADMTAGFSLGEITALFACGAADLETAFMLVRKRGEYMQQCAEANPANMAAVVKLSREEIEHICERTEDCWPVNYNSPGQTTIAYKGDFAGISDQVKSAGGKAIPLKVGGGFHSPLMNEASEQFRLLLDTVKLNAPAIPLYSDVTGLPYPDDVKDLLAAQINSPVRWESLIINMVQAGAKTFIEAGPGNILSGLIKRIAVDAAIYQAGDCKLLNELKENLSGEHQC
ncbi:MAG: ACP S-malonyltransferase [Clostridiales bacterium]|jgi:[acyl-carrier-protein] S-malonyltransferase|nr:ACP S-malonyltransferase [Clostridiales bacterium]